MVLGANKRVTDDAGEYSNVYKLPGNFRQGQCVYRPRLGPAPLNHSTRDSARPRLGKAEPQTPWTARGPYHNKVFADR